jgi:reverse gyrase
LVEYAIFVSACPNCGGMITSSRLEKGLPCDKCLPEPSDPATSSIEEWHKIVASQLDRQGTLNRYREIIGLEDKSKEFVGVFRSLTSKQPWSAQITWAKRCLRGDSFSIIAPTGVGKTTFLSVLAVYMARLGKRVLMVSPTALLARQTAGWVKTYSKTYDHTIRVAELHGEETDKAKRESLGMVEDASANIVVVTAAGLGNLFEKLQKIGFGLILVDDVDALLRKSANIDRVIRLLGFSEEIQEVATKAILVRIRLARIFAQRGSDADEVESLLGEYRQLKKQIDEYRLTHSGLGQLIVSSATARPRGLKVKVFRELLGFDAGSSATYLRNIIDAEVKLEGDVLGQVVGLVKRLGRGGLIFVAKDYGKETAKKIEEALNAAGIKAAQTKSYFHKRVDDFASMRMDVLVGTASYYGKLVRGIDLPQSVRYTVFVGVPKFSSRLEDEELSPLGIIRLLYAMSELIRDPNDRQQAFQQAVKLRRMIQNLSPSDLRLVAQAIRENRQLTGYLGQVQEEIGVGRRIFHNQLAAPNMLRELSQSDRLIIQETPEGPLVLAPDVKTYIQASGRSSRLFGSKLAKGLSIVLVDNQRVMSALQRSMQIASANTKWFRLEELDLDALLREIDEDRRLASNVEKDRDLIKTALLIVESPNKARTIANFFGRPGRLYINGKVFYEVVINNTLFTITSSGGHIIDLPNEASRTQNYGVPKVRNRFVPLYDFLNRCRSCGFQFTGSKPLCPKCGSQDVQSSLDVVDALRRVAADVPTVYIGTDPDSEGEKIAWDLAMLLSPYTSNIKRIRFHEVTPNALLGAIASASDINLNMVAAQIVRRVDDRWVGYGLTDLLTRNKRRLLTRGLERLRVPVGRVQLPTLGYVIRRSEEFKANKVRRFRLTCNGTGGVNLGLTLSLPFKQLDAKQVRALKNRLSQANVSVVDVYTEKVKLNPPPPYTTDSVLEDASRNFGWSVGEIMRRLQDLFEAGLITYHRTDHTHVSSAGIEIARTYLESTWGNEWRQLFQPRKWGEEGAHECIRPTRPLNAEELKRQIDLLEIQGAEHLDYRHMRLYDLIFRRFIASQMSPSVLVKQKADLEVEGISTKVEGYVGVEVDGYTRVNPPRMSVRLVKGQSLRVVDLQYKVSSTSPLPTEGDTVAYMKEKGIGRPSTYASTIEKLKQHGYVFPTPKNRLVPTTTGKTIYGFLNNELKTLTTILGEHYTAELQEKLQDIEEGKIDYNAIIQECFKDFQLIKNLAKRVN